jgi:hypothetical protein
MKRIFTAILFAIITGFIGWMAGLNYAPRPVVTLDLLDVRATQRELVRRGYPVTVDGIYGPETDHYLNLAVCQQHASKHEVKQCTTKP